MRPVRWGIIGAGGIARRLSACFPAAPNNVGYAIASRSGERAAAFAREFGFPVAYGSYEELVADPHVDAVYVATPHPQHLPHAQLALRAGKPTLCEKPFTVNAGEARALIATARECGVFLMEAMWTRFFPAYQRALALLAAGEIGALTYLSAEIGFRSRAGAESRLFDPGLAGGALLDVGVYPVALAADCFGGPPMRMNALAHLTAAKCPHAHLTAAKCPHAHLTAAKGDPTDRPHAHIGATGVDERLALQFGYAGGALCSLRCSIRDEMAGGAHLMGERGEITLHAPWWACQRLTVRRDGQAAAEFDFPAAAEGYEYQLEEFARLPAGGGAGDARACRWRNRWRSWRRWTQCGRRLGCGTRLSDDTSCRWDDTLGRRTTLRVFLTTLRVVC